MNKPLLLGFLALTSSFLLVRSSFSQGSLTPPGAPAATMKTLDQVEARIPLSSAVGNLQPGSYYLTQNITVASGTPFNINNDSTTLDLNGYTITSTASPPSGAAILIGTSRKNVVIKNGFIVGQTTFSGGTFTTGGFFSAIGTSGENTNCRASDLTVSGIAGAAIAFTASSPAAKNVVERCSVTTCSGVGIQAGTVRECTVDTAGGSAIVATFAESCFGQSVSASATADGISAVSLAANCVGVAVAGVGIDGTGAVTNSAGTSTSNIGLRGANVTNSEGTSTSGSIGLQATGTASFCRGKRDGGVAINAPIAIGCTVNGTGTVTSAQKHLGTP